MLINIGFYVFCDPMGAQFKGIIHRHVENML